MSSPSGIPKEFQPLLRQVAKEEEVPVTPARPRKKPGQGRLLPRNTSQTFLGRSANGEIHSQMPARTSSATQARAALKPTTTKSTHVPKAHRCAEGAVVLGPILETPELAASAHSQHQGPAELIDLTEDPDTSTSKRSQPRTSRVLLWDPRSLHCLFHCTHTICAKILQSSNRNDLLCNCHRILECNKQLHSRRESQTAIQQEDTTLGVHLNAAKTPLEERACANLAPDAEIRIWFSDVGPFLADIQNTATIEDYAAFEAVISTTLHSLDVETALSEARTLLFTDLTSYFDLSFLRVPLHGLPYRVVTPEILKREIIIFLRLCFVELLAKYFPSEAGVSPGQDFEARAFAGWLRNSEAARSLWGVWEGVIEEVVALCVWKHFRVLFRDAGVGRRIVEV
ncbi:hypothetical protein BDV96DRAFT_650557 [Lophiotrema nucula]|uniref:Uncharacterized protein n=1 Tax=Lophiotrema nucula TaxID=690887 RepID=A0A6A5YVP7_9PLEO|nr:hypothetical protein BDV96DRAFT_650557 [Lophiotrema nucula]